MVARLRLYHHKVTGHTGQYQAPRKSYSRKLCLITMLAMDPGLKTIFVKQGSVTIERAFLSKKRRQQKQLWHFYSNAKLDEVTLSLPDLAKLGVDLDNDDTTTY